MQHQAFQPFDPITATMLPPVSDEVTTDTSLVCLLRGADISTDEITQLEQEPVDDVNARDEVWVHKNDMDGIRWGVAPIRIGMGTLHVNHVKVVDEDALQVTLHWRGKQWSVCSVLTCCLSENPSTIFSHLASFQSMRHGFFEALQELEPHMREPITALLMKNWIESVALVRDRRMKLDEELRTTSMPVPSATGQIMPYAVYGKTQSSVASKLKTITRVTGGGELSERMVDGVKRTQRAPIELSITTAGRASKGRAAKIVLPTEWTQPRLFPTQGDEKEMAALVIEELAQVLGAKNLMPALAFFGRIAQRGRVYLEDDSLPADLRREVMALTGKPSNTANAVQRGNYEKLAEYVRWAQVMVNTKDPSTENGKRTKRVLGYRPLLLVSEFADAERVIATAVVVNPDVMGAMVQVPRPLLAITDEDDPAGLRRALGAMVMWRVAQSSCKAERLTRPESLVKSMDRMGLSHWMRDQVVKNGATAVMKMMDRELDALRSLRWQHGPHESVADVIGSTHIQWGNIGKGAHALDGARMQFGVPPWMARALPAPAEMDQEQTLAG